MTLIVDASVAIKWVVQEEGRAAALALLEREGPLLALSLMAAEVANILWRKARLGQVNPDVIRLALTSVLSQFDAFEPCETLAARALVLAEALGHPAYDCFYLALAEVQAGTLVTADQRLITRLGEGGWIGRWEGI